MTAGRWLLPALALLPGACGTPQTECRDAIADMQKKVARMLESNELKDAVPPVQAEVTVAEARQAAGDYPGCIDAVARARAELNRSQRTNQQ